MFIDKQGMIGWKVEYYFVFYKVIIQFKVEMVGYFDMDVELCIFILGQFEVLKFELKKDIVIGVQKLFVNVMFG